MTLAIQKGDIECGVVKHEHAAGRGLQERFQDRRGGRALGQFPVVDMVNGGALANSLLSGNQVVARTGELDGAVLDGNPAEA